MSAAARRKGAVYERAGVVYLKARGLTADRILREHQGAEDLTVEEWPHIALEFKNQKRDGLPGWVDQAVRQAGPARIGVVWHKRAGRADLGEHFVTMRAGDLVTLLNAAGIAETVAGMCEAIDNVRNPNP